MQIQSIGTNHNLINTNFKSAIPTVFWEKSPNSVELITDFNLTKRLGKIVVRRANGKGAATKGAILERKKVMSLLYDKDRDYRLAFDKKGIASRYTVADTITGCFCPQKDKTGWMYGKFKPRAFLMTGPDHNIMRDFGENIGNISKQCDIVQTNKAKEQYVQKGKALTALPTKEELHVIVEKNKNDGYKILKLDMYPAEGPRSPYTIMGYYI